MVTNLFIVPAIFSALSATDARYKDSFLASANAAYRSSEIKTVFDKASMNLKNNFLFTPLFIGYSVGYRQQIKISIPKFYVLNSVTTYQYNNTNKTGQINFTWNF